MTTEKLRYVSRRLNRNGKARWYWRRPGFPLVRLPDDRVKRFAMVERLNEQADRAAVIDTTAEGTLGWVIEKYRQGDEFTDLAVSTQGIYERWLREFEQMWGLMPPNVLTRRVVVTYVETINSSASRHVAVAVLFNVLQKARFYGLVEVNNASALGLKSPKPRNQRWEWEHIERFLAICTDDTVRTAFYLLLYTAQRPIDVVQMRWDAYNGDTIKLRQQKTGKLVEVACHKDLRLFLDDAKAKRNGLNIVSRRDGRPVSRAWLTDKFKHLRSVCGLKHLQARDLRRTAMILMGEAGATDLQIAAVSGHDIETTRRILDTYVPRTVEMSRGAIRSWEQNG